MIRSIGRYSRSDQHRPVITTDLNLINLIKHRPSKERGKWLSFLYNSMNFGFGKEQVRGAVRHNPLQSQGFLVDAIMKQRLFWGPLAVTLLAANAGLAQERPNIALILSDDQGWYGLSVQMHPDLPNSKSDFFRTPLGPQGSPSL